jgi:hypothetical protein
MLSTPKTVIKNFLHAMATASREPDVEQSIDSRLERFKLCGMTTVFGVVGHRYRLHQVNCFDYMNDRIGEMTTVDVCNIEYELICEVGAICLVHQHRMQPFHQQPFMNQTTGVIWVQ